LGWFWRAVDGVPLNKRESAVQGWARPMALWLLCCGLPWVFVGGCDEEESPPKVEEVVLFPLSFNAETRGIAVFPGDEGIVALTEWSKLAAGAQWLVIRAQLVDELLISREGEAGLLRRGWRISARM